MPKKSCDDPWMSNDSIGLKLRKSIKKMYRNAVPVHSVTRKTLSKSNSSVIAKKLPDAADFGVGVNTNLTS
jgi:hypothetical protein